jgi:uncharacterized membrane protein
MTHRAHDEQTLSRSLPRSAGRAGTGGAVSRWRPNLMRWAVFAVTGAVFLLWLIGTPPGLHGKAHAVGYAVCHQMEQRTFFASDKPMPLCARCTGTYLGVLVGFLAPLFLGRGRAGKFPPWPVLGVLLLFSALWAIDGVNSYLSAFPNAPHLYQPRNELRLITGSLHGLTMSGLIYPVFNQAVWREWRRQHSLRHLGDLAVLVLGVLLLDGLVMLGPPILLEVLGYLSTLGVILIMTAINTVVVVTLSQRENWATGWGDLAVLLAAAFGLAILLIGVIDAGRFALFGTWEGFTLPPTNPG